MFQIDQAMQQAVARTIGLRIANDGTVPPIVDQNIEFAAGFDLMPPNRRNINDITGQQVTGLCGSQCGRVV